MAPSVFQFASVVVGPTVVRSPNRTLPASVDSMVLQLSDPAGDWRNPAKAGGNFIYGVEYSEDGGNTWKVLGSNGIGQPVGSLNKDGSLPHVDIDWGTGLQEARNNPCRLFASCTPATITVGVTVTVSR